MYEEKSTEQIAEQVGLSENATRQLIFRARAAFKKALIGDVDTTGMSAAAILSVAARKAASEGKKVGAAALTLIALVVMSFTAFPGLNRAPTDQMAEGTTSGTSQEANTGSGNSSSTDGSIGVLPTPDNGIVDSTDPSGTAGTNGNTSSGAAGSGSSGSSSTGTGSTTNDEIPIETNLEALELDIDGDPNTIDDATNIRKINMIIEIIK
jgi:RNA polymerase sigma-70 factor (ECF subfamily)